MRRKNFKKTQKNNFKISEESWAKQMPGLGLGDTRVAGHEAKLQNTDERIAEMITTQGKLFLQYSGGVKDPK